MTWLSWLVFLLGALAFWQAWRTLRHTSLAHALAWGVGAWLAWGGVLLLDQVASSAAATAGRYLALSLVGCAGVAVLGARRPGVAAWDFVVLGLLAVLLLFLAEGALTGGELQLGPVRTAFLALTLAAGIANYLPTQMAPSALLLAVGCACELWDLVQRPSPAFLGKPYAELLILLAPPTALLTCWKTGHEVDRLWRSFRDSFGLIWGLRLREQFNRAAANAALPVELGWSGLRSASGKDEPDALASAASLGLLRALLKRFGPETPGQGETTASVVGREAGAHQ